LTASFFDFSSVDGALQRYRVLAVVVGISILVLVCIGIPLDFGAGHPVIDKKLGFVHGAFFYPLYIVLTLDLGRRVRIHPIHLVLIIVLGTIPVASIYAERYTTKFVRNRQAELAAEPV
jgi:integral membrane protein